MPTVICVHRSEPFPMHPFSYYYGYYESDAKVREIIMRSLWWLRQVPESRGGLVRTEKRSLHFDQSIDYPNKS